MAESKNKPVNKDRIAMASVRADGELDQTNPEFIDKDSGEAALAKQRETLADDGRDALAATDRPRGEKR